jgi:hypothetical protein
MGEHIKQALEATSSSHSSNWFEMFETVKDIFLLGEMASTGHIGAKKIIGGVGSTGMMLGAGWIIGNSARTASLSAWTRAYQGLTLSPTPARIATFNMATRNLANTLGIPMEKLTSSIVSHLGRAEQPQADVGQNVERK